MMMNRAGVVEQTPVQRKREKRDVHGWVIFDKPVGMTSTHAVGTVKRLFAAKRAGHAGTLDPLASGLLPIALIACMSSGPTVADENAAVPLGVDLGGSGPVAASPQPKAPTRTAFAAEDHPSHPQHGSEMQMAHEGHNDANGIGTVNSVDPAQARGARGYLPSFWRRRSPNVPKPCLAASLR